MLFVSVPLSFAPRFIAFLEGPMTALWVVIFYFVIQSVEKSYVLVPVIYERTVAISPVVNPSYLVFFGVLAGPPGIILTTGSDHLFHEKNKPSTADQVTTSK